MKQVLQYRRSGTTVRRRRTGAAGATRRGPGPHGLVAHQSRHRAHAGRGQRRQPAEYRRATNGPGAAGGRQGPARRHRRHGPGGSRSAGCGHPARLQLRRHRARTERRRSRYRRWRSGGVRGQRIREPCRVRRRAAQPAVRVPDAVSLEDAAFVTVGAIALHGVRIADSARRRHVCGDRPGPGRAAHGATAEGRRLPRVRRGRRRKTRIELARSQRRRRACLRSDPDLEQRSATSRTVAARTRC